jgi:quercetin dioxygenase-like cupin family protein
MGESMAEDKPFLPETETAVPIICQPGEGKVVGVLGGRMTFKVLDDHTGGAYAIVEQQIPAGQGPLLHVHRHETEIFYILEGQFEVTIGGQKMAVSVGVMVVAPRDIPHPFRNVGPHEGRFLLTFIPGRFANYFIEADGVPDNDRAAIKALFAKNDVDIIMRAGPNQSLHLTEAASRFFRLQSLSSGPGR